MPRNVYECLFLLDTGRVASSGGVTEAARKLHDLLERHQAEILVSRPWDERRLAYPIKKHKKGLYYLIYFRAEARSLADIHRDCQLTEMILRHLILKVHPKLVEPLLQVARDEHALALQSASDHKEIREKEGASRAGREDSAAPASKT